MKKKFFFLLLILLPALLFSQKSKTHPRAGYSRILPPKIIDSFRVYKLRSYFHHISDINYREGEYKMELWLYLTNKDSVPETLMDQIEVKDAKEFKISFIPQWIHPDSPKIYKRRAYKLICTMINKWQMGNYPFGRQTLDITIYNTNPKDWVLLDPSEVSYSLVNEKGIFEIGNGWHFDTASVRTNKETVIGVFRKDRAYSAVHYSIPLKQDTPGLLFLKLFLGMYVAFFVAFIALFIPVESEEPRFGLPVGGLFAAIGNKYIIEALLPVSTDYALVDILHSITIVFILLVVAYSAFLLYLNKKKKSFELAQKKQENSTLRQYYIIPALRMDLRTFDLIIVGIITVSFIILNLIYILSAIHSGANAG